MSHTQYRIDQEPNGTSTKNKSHQMRDFCDELNIRGIYIENAYMLELGCGHGFVTQAFQHLQADVKGIHCSPQEISIAQKQNPEAYYLKGNPEYLPFEKDSFDIVYACNQWEHLDRNKVLSEVDRVLKPKGYLLILDANCRLDHEGVVYLTNELLSMYGQLPLTTYSHSSDEQAISFPPKWSEEWAKAGFTFIDEWSSTCNIEFTLKSWTNTVLQHTSDASNYIKSRIMDEIRAFLLNSTEEDTFHIPYACSTVILQK
ncbi:class I SAM-dependent methyltransferase [Pontibacillus yanchengensis]|uniref:SAM-dependent methlyltransferase n=1 Tax=Pontibacillus yanchengensis Y32 TaxID=1385514 RepID=A0A0A2TER7_9BACI|nr:class I SAM-dependent methyltransferase [Pontibacillus yanchengensis]KGP72611.1 SAM-dependent methlyltransferase [Pontibacillus yanchengensis Y32]